MANSFDQYFASHPDAVFLLDQALKIEAANDPALALLTAAGSSVGGALPFVDAAAVFRDAKAKRSKRALRQGSGGRLYELDIGSIEDNGVLVIARDITHFATRQSDLESRFQVMADAAPFMIWMSDNQGSRNWFNRPWLDFRGRTALQEITQGWAEGLHAGDRDRCLDIYQRCLTARQAFSMDYRLLRSDGQYRWMLDSGSPRYASNGVFTGYIGSCADIHERKELERQNAGQAEALREADRRKDEFVAMLAHELRNPLAPIETSAVILDRIGLADPAAANVSRVITRQVGHMRRLIDDLLDASRIDQGKLALDMAPFVLKDMVDAAIDATAPGRLEHRNGLQLDLQAQDAVLQGDVVRLTQAVSNLLDNASKFSPGGAPVSLGVRLVDGQLRVVVSDQGVGMPGDFLPHAFDLFTQFEPGLSRTRGGLGIGLTVAREVARLHGGQLAAHSAGAGRGAQFVLEIPARLIPQPVMKSTAPAVPDGHFRILLVEDSEDAREALAELLRMMGHAVLEACCAEEALQQAPAFGPELVLCDIGLPDKSGHHLVEELRSVLEPAPVLFAALSGYSPERNKTDASRIGFDAYLVKPIAMAELEALLRLAGDRRAGN